MYIYHFLGATLELLPIARPLGPQLGSGFGRYFFVFCNLTSVLTYSSSKLGAALYLYKLNYLLTSHPFGVVYEKGMFRKHF